MPGKKRSYAQALAGNAAASPPQSGKQVRPSPIEYRMPGSIVLDGTLQHPDEALAAMLDLENHVCQNGDIGLLIVCDGAGTSKKGKKGSVKKESPFGQGGYALVFKRFSPGSPDHGVTVEQAWTVSPSIDSNLLESVALLQSLWQANKEIREAIQGERLYRLGGGSGQAGSLTTRDLPIKVTIGSDSKNTLQRLQREALRRDVPSDTHRPQPPLPSTQSNPSGTNAGPGQSNQPQSSHQPTEFTFVPPGPVPALKFPPVPQLTRDQVKKCQDEVIQLCVRQAQRLYDLPGGFKVDLTLRWVPSHKLASKMKFHPRADHLASDARQKRQHHHTVNDVAVPFAPSVVRGIKNFPMKAESSPDTPSDDEVLMCHSADCAAKTAAHEERHQDKMGQLDSVREQLDAALKDMEASRAKLEAAEKRLEDWTELDRITLEKVEEAKTLCDDAGTVLREVTEQMDGLRAALQLLQEDKNHEYRLQRERDAARLEGAAMQISQLQQELDQERLQRQRDADSATTQILQQQQERDLDRLQRELEQDRAAVQLFSAVVGAAGLIQRLFA